MTSTFSSTIDIPAQVGALVAAAHERKAVDLRVLHTEPVSGLADYFVICGGESDRQTRAIADAVEERLRSERVRPLHVEGVRGGQWILLDYGDFLVHVMNEEARAFYGLERLWADAPDVTGQFASSGDDSPAPTVQG